MLDRNYTVSRNDIYVGQVTLCQKVSVRENNNPINLKMGHLRTSTIKIYRSILFIPTKEYMVNDLLYNSPFYPILNFTRDDICLDLKNSILINNACNLAPLLEYFKFRETLQYKDILRIRNTFFKRYFAYNHFSLFGFKEVQSKIYYENGEKKFAKKEYSPYSYNIRFLAPAFDGILPHEYYNIWDDLENNSFIDVLTGMNTKRNTFIPSKEEQVRRLKRF